MPPVKLDVFKFTSALGAKNSARIFAPEPTLIA